MVLVDQDMNEELSLLSLSFFLKHANDNRVRKHKHLLKLKLSLGINSA